MLLNLVWGKLFGFLLGLKETFQFLLSVCIAIVPAIICLLTNRKKLSNLHDAFHFFSQLPLGISLFSTLVGVYAPYSASVSPTVRSMQKSDNYFQVVATMEDRPWLRNPFQSVHAVALTNLGECASGVAIVSALQDKRFKNIRGIPVSIDTKYYKKGRGRMIATANIKLSDLEAGESKFETVVTDLKGEQIALCVVTWSFRDKSVNQQEGNPKKKD